MERACFFSRTRDARLKGSGKRPKIPTPLWKHLETDGGTPMRPRHQVTGSRTRPPVKNSLGRRSGLGWKQKIGAPRLEARARNCDGENGRLRVILGVRCVPYDHYALHVAASISSWRAGGRTTPAVPITRPRAPQAARDLEPMTLGSLQYQTTTCK